jgi:hypothetical protein
MLMTYAVRWHTLDVHAFFSILSTFLDVIKLDLMAMFAELQSRDLPLFKPNFNLGLSLSYRKRMILLELRKRYQFG